MIAIARLEPKYLIRFVSFLLLLSPLCGYSDETYDLDRASGASNPAQPLMADVNKVGSAASFDKRLPPVIPGENIQHNGRTTKVWSSSGPVPVGPLFTAPPGAPQPGGQAAGQPASVGVIVDSRPRTDSNR